MLNLLYAKGRSYIRDNIYEYPPNDISDKILVCETGSTAKVYKARLVSDSSTVAVKVFKDSIDSKKKAKVHKSSVYPIYNVPEILSVFRQRITERRQRWLEGLPEYHRL